MTKEEKNELITLCDRIYFGEAVDVDDIDALESLYTGVKRLIGYKPNQKRFVASLTGAEKESLDIELLNFVNRKYENK